MTHRTFSKLALVFAFATLTHCGQFVVPEDASADRAFDAVGDGETLPDATGADVRIDGGSTTDSDSDSSTAADSNADAAETGSGVSGDLPPSDVTIENANCHNLPFGAIVRLEDADGPMPYPLPGGGTIPDGVYRLRRVQRYLEGQPVPPNRVLYFGEILRIRGLVWEYSTRFSLTNPFDLRVGFYRRVTFAVRYEPPFRIRTTTSCPSNMNYLFGDTYEINGSVLRINAGDMIMEYARD